MQRLIGYREMRQQYEKLGPNAACRHLKESLDKGHLSHNDFSIRELAEAFVPDGREWVASMNPKYGGLSLLEAEAVNTAAFSNITGQIIYSAIMEGFNSPAFVFSSLIPTQQTQFSGEKIPGIGGIGDVAEKIEEAGKYPHVSFNEDWIETPSTIKRGFIVPVTKEAIFFDRTGLVVRRAGEVGEYLGLNKEKRLIDCVVDENTTAHRYKWRGTTYATYQTSTPWDNVTASNALVDWTDVEAAKQTLSAINDPNTGEPFMVMYDTLICTNELEWTARRIVNATQITVTTPGYATSANPTETVTSNPVPGLNIVSSPLLDRRMATDTSWFVGNPRKAFAYMQNWPVTVVQAPSNSEAEFEQDIVLRFKASERGAAATLEPRVMTKCTVA